MPLEKEKESEAMALSDYKAAPVVKLDSLADVNDIGKPWRYEDGDYTVTRTCPWSPPGCHPVGCGLKLYVNEDGRLEHVEGDENHPVTQGRLCPRCITLKDYVYSPARILTPMKRDRAERGNADAWEECSWDEAFAIIKENYERIVDQYGPESIIGMSGTGREGGTMSLYPTMVFGTPNYCYMQSGYACYTPRLAAAAYITGSTYSEWDYAGALPDRWDDERYTLTEVLVMWGKAPLESNPDGFFGHAVVDAMRRGHPPHPDRPARQLAVRPRRHFHPAARRHGHAHSPWPCSTSSSRRTSTITSSSSTGATASSSSPSASPRCLAEKAAEICQVPVEKIYAAARMYAKAKPAAILWGLAVDQKTDGMQNSRASSRSGHHRQLRPPGWSARSRRRCRPQRARLWLQGMHPRRALPEDDRHGPVPRVLQHDPQLAGRPHARGPRDRRAVSAPHGLLHGFQPAVEHLDGAQALATALCKSLEFCIGIDLFMNASIQATCDIFLPIATIAEREGTVFTHYAPCTVTAGFMHKAVDCGGLPSDMELAYRLGKYLHPERFSKWANEHELVEAFRLGCREPWRDLRRGFQCVVAQVPIEYYKYEKGLLRQDGQVGFATPTGRVELWSTAYNQFGEDPLPYYIEPEFSPVSKPELMDEYPLILTTGARTTAFFHSENRQIPYTRELNPDPLLEINPKTAQEKGIADGQWVRVWNMFGEALMKAKVSEAVDEPVHGQHGWWFPRRTAASRTSTAPSARRSITCAPTAAWASWDSALPTSA